MLERVRVLTCGQSEVLQADLVFSPVLPAEQHGHLEGGDLQVKFASPEKKFAGDMRGADRLILISECDGPVGHVMMPLQLPAAVLGLVEFLDLKYDSVNMSGWQDLLPTSGMKSSSSRGSVTGTLSLVLAQAPMLRILMETVSAIRSFL